MFQFLPLLFFFFWPLLNKNKIRSKDLSSAGLVEAHFHGRLMIRQIKILKILHGAKVLLALNSK